jgi:DNA-binding transcriptional regulator YhcF (GntR family)
VNDPGLRLDAQVVPASARVREGVRSAIHDGRLLPEDRLPTVRALAAERGLAPNTVAKAYRELEDLGYLTARGRAGTFVAAIPPVVSDPDGLALAEAAGRFARQVRRLGATPTAALVAVRGALGSPDP